MINPVMSKERIFRSLIKYEKWNNEREDGLICIAYIGHLMESKGFKRALLIGERLIKSNLRIVIKFYGEFGSDNDKEFFKRFIEDADLNDKVLYCGNYSHDKVWTAFINTHVVILPTYTEAYPLTILEALSVGVPVVATHTGAIPEIIDNYSGEVIQHFGSELEFIDGFVRAVNSILNYWDIDKSKNLIQRFDDKWCKNRFANKITEILLS